MMRDLIEADTLPDYRLEEEPGDILRISPRRHAAAAVATDLPLVSAEALDQARVLAPGWDVHALCAEWQSWWAMSGRALLRSPDKAFLGWIKVRMG